MKSIVGTTNTQLKEEKGGKKIGLYGNEQCFEQLKREFGGMLTLEYKGQTIFLEKNGYFSR